MTVRFRWDPQPVTEENPKSEEGETDEWDPIKGDLLGTTVRLHGRKGRERGGAVDNVKKKLRYSIFETKKKIQSFYSCVRLVKVHFIKGDWIG